MRTRLLSLRSPALPVFAGLAAALLVLLGVWLLERSERDRLVQKERLDLLRQLSAISTRIEAGLLLRVDITNHLAAQVAANPDIDLAEFISIARALVARHTGIVAIQLARDSIVSHCYPSRGSAESLGTNLLDPAVDRRAEALRRAIQTHRTLIAGPEPLAGGATGVICRTPVYIYSSGLSRTPHYWGLATVVIDAQVLFDEAGLSREAPELQIALRGKDGLGAAGEIFFGSPGLFTQNPIVADVTLPGGTWQLGALPTARPHLRHQLFLIWLGGGLLACFAGGLVFFAVRKPQQLAALIRSYQEVEQSLRLSEEQYRAVVENANEGIAVAQDGFFRFVNPKLAALLDYSREELLSRPFEAFLHPDDREMVLHRHWTRLQGGALPTVYTFRVLERSGAIRWFEINAVLIDWQDRPAALTFLNDVTRRRQAEDALQESVNELERRVEARTAEFKKINEQLLIEIRERNKIEQELTVSESHFRSLLENARHAVVYRLEADSSSPYGARVLLVSPSVRDILGLLEPHRFETWFQYVHPDDAGRVREANRAAWTTGSPFNMQFRWLNALRQEWLWIHGIATPVLDSFGTVAYFNGLAFDITAQKAAEESLRESEQKYRRVSQEFHALLDGIADALLHIAPDMSILWANRAAASAMDADMPTLIGSPCYRSWYGRASACEDCPIVETFRTGRPERCQKTTRDGRCWDIRSFPIRNESGAVISVIEIAADITELSKFQSQAARTSQLVSLGELAAGVAHEINNPLGGTVLCFRELMQPDIDASSRDSLCRVIDSELVRMKTIVDRLLTFSRMTVTRKSPVNLNRLVESILVLCRYQFAAKKLALATEFAPDAPDVVVEENKIEQVFINIMLNALHAMEEGGMLTITTARHADSCSISFTDTGCGIAPEILPRIFDPFFTTRADQGGTGLGLSISREIVEQHGGAIEAISSPGKGSRVVVRLPLAPAREGGESADENSGH